VVLFSPSLVEFIEALTVASSRSAAAKDVRFR
jgi:hypothetical protein